jgi:hypothetical protein
MRFAGSSQPQMTATAASAATDPARLAWDLTRLL